ncbi:MAG: ABC transporter permease [Chloroflexota bacterium]
MNQAIIHQKTTLAARLEWLTSSESRYLFWELVRANYRLNDHNSILGVLWSLLSPLTMLLVLYFIFRDRFGQNIEGYIVYLMLGIVTVNLFSTVTKQLMSTFLTNKIAFRNVIMPKEIFILAQATAHFAKFGIELAFCLLIALLSGVLQWQGLLLLWPLLIAFTVFVFGVSLILALAYSVVRDIEHLWTLGMRLLLFVTPVFYGLDVLSVPARTAVYWLNPLTPFLIAFRGVIMGDKEYTSGVYFHAILLAILAIVPAYALFLRYETQAMERA